MGSDRFPTIPIDSATTFATTLGEKRGVKRQKRFKKRRFLAGTQPRETIDDKRRFLWQVLLDHMSFLIAFSKSDSNKCK